MGVLESKQERERENFLLSYQAIEQKSSGVYGECTIMKSSRGAPIILKEKTFVTGSQMKAERDKLQGFKDEILKHDNILEIKEIFTSSQTHLCSGSHKLLWAVEYNPRSLSTEFFTRRIQNQTFSESEIWSLLKESSSALTFLQSKSLNHGDIRPNTILITNDGTVKLTHPDLFNTQNSFAQVLLDRGSQSYYLSPQLVTSLEKNDYFPKHDGYKSDVFSLGIILLEVGNLKTFSTDLYDLKKGKLHYDVVLKEIQEFRAKFSQELTEVIWHMTEYHEERRPDWFEFTRILLDRDRLGRSAQNLNEGHMYQYRQSSARQNLKFDRSSSNMLLLELYSREDQLAKRINN